MRSGLALDETMPIDSVLMKRIESLLYTFMEHATVHSATYVREGNRNTLTTMDMVYGLKYCAHTFFHEMNLEDNIDANILKLDDDEETDDDFVRNETSLNPLVLKMNQYVDEWASWWPTDEVEIMIKRTIDKMEVQSDLNF